MFITLLAKGDYGVRFLCITCKFGRLIIVFIQPGLPGCSARTALELSRAGFSRSLLHAVETMDPYHLGPFLNVWCNELKNEPRTNNSGMLSSRRPGLANAIPNDYPTAADFRVLGLYREPLISVHDGSCKPHALVHWNLMKPAKLAQFLEGNFSSWGSDYGILMDFCKHVFPGLVLREFIQQVLESEGGEDTLTMCRLFKDVILNPGPHQAERYREEMRVKLVLSSMLIQEITSGLSGNHSTPESALKVATLHNPDNQNIVAWIPRMILFDPSVIQYRKHLNPANGITAGVFNGQLLSCLI